MMQPRHTFNARGFTLIELLAAMAIFSLLAVVMYGGTQWIMLEREIIMARQAELHALQRTINLLNNDFAQLRLRQIRDELGRDYLPALMSDQAGEFLVELSHDGWRNPAGAARGTLQRVQYRLEQAPVEEDGNTPSDSTFTLVREYWPVMDRVLGMKGRTQNLLTDVEKFTLEYLDTDGEWRDVWPPLSANAENSNIIAGYLPVAVRYRLESTTFGPIERTIEVPQ